MSADSPKFCGFGLNMFAEGIDGCTEPARHRLFIPAEELEAFACDAHLAEAAGSAAGMNGDRAFTVASVDPPDGTE